MPRTLKAERHYSVSAFCYLDIPSVARFLKEKFPNVLWRGVFKCWCKKSNDNERTYKVIFRCDPRPVCRLSKHSSSRIKGYNNPLLYAVRGKFKEICERPNGVCQLYCLETEVYVGRCLNRRPCCLPMGNQPRVEDDTPKSWSLSLGSLTACFILASLSPVLSFSLLCFWIGSCPFLNK